MKIIVSNMVCNRCIMVIESILSNMGIENYIVSMGQIKLQEALSSSETEVLRKELDKVGFQLVEDKTEKIIEEIKASLVKYLDALAKGETAKMSSFITQYVFYDYSYLSDLFSKTENKTIEKYFIEMRLDKAKELLKYSADDISSIAYQLGFSTPQHFGNQFKQHVGMTPNSFRKLHRM